MKKSLLFGAVCSCLLVALSNKALAAVMNPISNLNINGTLYNVTFHAWDDTFNDLWDADNDGVFGGGGSVFSTAPTFWGDQFAGELARDAIIGALGTTGETTPGWDGFVIPIGVNGGLLTSGTDSIFLALDANGNLTSDGPGLLSWDDNYSGSIAFAYASFAAVVPIPASAWLFCSGIIGLIGLSRRRKAV